MREETYVKTNYDVSAFPFNHEETRQFGVTVESRPDGRYVVKDRGGAFVTRDGKVDKRRILMDFPAHFEQFCLMSEEEALEVAKRYVLQITVNGFTVADAKKTQGMSLKEFEEYRKKMVEELRNGTRPRNSGNTLDYADFGMRVN